MKKTVTLLLLILTIPFFNQQAQALTLKIATLAPAGTSWMKEMKKGAKAIKKKTGDRVKLKFYPGGVMGNDASVHRKIRINQLQGGAFSASGMSHIDTSIQLLSLPMMFKDFDEVDHVRSVMDEKIKAHMARKGFIILGITEGGFGRIFSSKPIGNLEQIRATKVWMPEGDQLVQASLDALGVQPIALPLADVFTGLQTGLIETITATSTGAIALQWHTKVNYMIDIPVLYVIGVLAVSEKAFNKIKPDDQKIVLEEMGTAFKRLGEINRRDNVGATEALKSQGIQVLTPDAAEIATWKRLSRESIDRIIADGNLDPVLFKEMEQLLQ
jgi:TRAP-type C4-dicarboxylate transport system substrate-binding protein